MPVKTSSHTQGFTVCSWWATSTLNGESYFWKIKEEGERKEKKRAFPFDHANTTLQASISYWMFSPVEELFLCTIFHIVATVQISSKCSLTCYSYSCLNFFIGSSNIDKYLQPKGRKRTERGVDPQASGSHVPSNYHNKQYCGLWVQVREKKLHEGTSMGT